MTFKKTLNGVQTQRKIECPVISLNSKFQPKFTKTNNNNQKFYNKDYRNYISYYYPEYATYYNYNYHHQQPANLQTNFLKNNILQKKQQIYKEQKNNNIPVRTVSVSIFTTPPSTVHFYFFKNFFFINVLNTTIFLLYKFNSFYINIF